MMMQTNGLDLRQDFPILDRKVHGKPLVYLDNAASAQKPRAVIDAMTRAMTSSYANVHRGLHAMASETTEAFEASRASVQRFVNASSADEIIFTAGGTDAINLVAYSLGAPKSLGGEIGEGDEIIVSRMEHHSNIVPWHLLRQRNGAVIRWLDISDDGVIDLDAFEGLFTSRTRLVAVTHMSNVFGALTPVREMTRIAHAHGAKILVDGCQGAVHSAVDVQHIGCDFYVLTGHKLYGPSGVGALYGRASVLRAMPPFRGGGEMIDIVEMDRITYNDPPHRFEAGTPPILEVIGLGAAVEWMMAKGVDALSSWEATLAEAAQSALQQLNFVRLYGTAPGKSPIFAFNVDGAHPHDVATILDRSGIAVRAGHHCTQPLMTRLGVSATTRASFAAYNTLDEVERLVEGLSKVRNILG